MNLGENFSISPFDKHRDQRIQLELRLPLNSPELAASTFSSILFIIIGEYYNIIMEAIKIVLKLIKKLSQKTQRSELQLGRLIARSQALLRA